MTGCWCGVAGRISVRRSGYGRRRPLAELRRRLGVLFQDFMQYDLTAGENVGVGDLPNLDDLRRVSGAARAAGVHDKLVSLPNGYHTMLSRVFFREADKKDPDKGVMLSGGQWSGWPSRAPSCARDVTC